MRFLSLSEVVELHRLLVESSGGSKGIRDLGILESAVSQPRTTFGETDLYPTLIEKAAALCFSLSHNHPFVDGNKRVAHAAMETLLVLNGYAIDATVDEQEQTMLALAQSSVSREELVAWLRGHVRPIG
jgi:death on curing protein